MTMRRRPDCDRVLAWLAMAVTASLAMVLLAPAFRWLVTSWRLSAYYSHGPLIPPVAAWLLWTRRGDLAARQGIWLGVVPMMAGVGLWSLGARWGSPPLTLLATLPILLGLVLLERGWQACRAAVPAALLLATAVPLPWVERVGPPLAGAVATLAARALTVLSIPVVQEGALLATKDGTFHVGGPCSGLRSALALVTLALTAAVVLPLQPKRRLALILLAAPLALVANWLRLMGLFLSSQFMGTAQAMVFYHRLASPMWFLAATATLFALALRTNDHYGPATRHGDG